MGLLSWLFPSPEDRVVRARKALAAGHFRQARDDVDGVEAPGAEDVRREANNGLVRLNLAAAVACAEGGGDERIADHLALAESLHAGGLEDAFRDARRQIREVRERRTREAKQRAIEQARLADDDPIGLTGQGLLRDTRSGPTVEADDHETAARLALIVENYPASLRDRAAALGRPFLDAVLQYEDGRPDLAWEALRALPDAEPLVQYERARCAYTGGQDPVAIECLEAFAATGGGHHPFGNEHSGALLGLLYARNGLFERSLGVLRPLRPSAPGAVNVLLAQVLLAVHRNAKAVGGPVGTSLLDEADSALGELLARSSKSTELWGLLADVRVEAGRRLPAMQALESSLASHCDAPGKCGYKPPDPAVQRRLATLYLEDGVEVARGLELADAALAKVDQPAWDDLYLDALSARTRGDAAADEAARALLQQTPADDPRREQIKRQFPAAA